MIAWRAWTVGFWIALQAQPGLMPAALAFDGDEQAIRQACPHFAQWQDAQRVRRAAAIAAESRPVAPAASNPELRDELLRMADRDQAARRSLPANPIGSEPEIKALLEVDANNLSRLRAIVAQYGFPLNTLVGDEGVGAAFLLVQHASDAEFQSRVLKQLQPRVKTGHIGADQFAMLADRIRVSQGRPQIYGTQLTGKGEGRLALAPIEDQRHVDQRRSRMGMPPLDDYLCVVKAAYGPSN